MEVKPGYKQTEVGVIPGDWEVKPANQLGAPVRGGSPRPAGDPRYFNGSYIPWLTVAALTNIPASQLVVSETATCLTEEGSLHSRTLTVGTLIIANSGATLGVAKILGVKCCANDGIAALLNLGTRISTHYLAHFINTKTSYLRDIVATGNGQPNLNTELIGNFKIPLPPTKAEQEAIAEALSDTDAFIESIEQLLAKKRQIKQGAMQELLTGKKRLPGFSGAGWNKTEVGDLPSDWRVVAIGLIAQVKTGPFGSSLHERDYVDDGTPIITVEHLGEDSVTHANLPMVSEADRRRLDAYSLEQGDVVFSRVGSVDRNALVTAAESGWLFSGRLLRLRASSGVVHTKYLSYQFHSEPFKQRVRTVAVGQTMASLNTQILKRVLVALPPVAEQTAIASILSDMDAEIAALGAKLAKARAIKQGMTQELLTGAIRLPVDVTKAA